MLDMSFVLLARDTFVLEDAKLLVFDEFVDDTTGEELLLQFIAEKLETILSLLLFNGDPESFLSSVLFDGLLYWIILMYNK